MEIANLRVLEQAGRKNAPLRSAIERWIDIVEEAEWRSIDDVRKTFPSADGVALKSGTVATVFNIGGNNHRMITVLFYQSQRVYVTEILTHGEYNKERWKGRL